MLLGPHAVGGRVSPSHSALLTVGLGLLYEFSQPAFDLKCCQLSISHFSFCVAKCKFVQVYKVSLYCQPISNNCLIVT